jgi:hypothetical protein
MEITMNHISRRSVVRNGAITAASVAMLTAVPKRLTADSLAKSAGIQLYTVDKELKQDMPGTLAKLAAIGPWRAPEWPERPPESFAMRSMPLG